MSDLRDQLQDYLSLAYSVMGRRISSMDPYDSDEFDYKELQAYIKSLHDEGITVPINKENAALSAASELEGMLGSNGWDAKKRAI